MHLIGKEIVRQHAIYWPAFLLAAELPLPRQIVSHGWWLMEGAKMSKSKGNVVRPQAYIDRFGLDALRYFVFREMVFGQDASFGDEAFLTRYNSDLANDLGNLVSRATTMIHRYRGGVVPAPGPGCAAAGTRTALATALDALIDSVKSSIRSFQLSVALREIWDVIGATNRYIVTREPWVWRRTRPGGRARHGAVRRGRHAAGRRRVDPAVHAGRGRTNAADARRRTGRASWVSLARGHADAGHRGSASRRALFPRIEQSVEELRQMADNTTTSPQPPGAPVPPEPTQATASPRRRSRRRRAAASPAAGRRDAGSRRQTIAFRSTTS